MEIYYTIQRPSLLPTAVCAPSVSPLPELVAERASVSRVHQVQIQAELAVALVGTDGSHGINGFVGSNVSAALANKRMTDGASGVPPRGRPV